MGIALWCDLKSNGHPFDEREGISVTWKDDFRCFCREHCLSAFITVFHSACTASEADICLPTLGGTFTVSPDDIPEDFKLPTLEELMQEPTPEQEAEDKRRSIKALLEILDAGPCLDHPDERLKGVTVLCCDATPKGHAFDRREAIIVREKSKRLNFCQRHCISAFAAAFRAAHSAGDSEIRIPALRGSFTIQRKDGQPEHASQPGKKKRPEQAAKTTAGAGTHTTPAYGGRA